MRLVLYSFNLCVMDNSELPLLLCPFGVFYQEGLAIYPVIMKRKTMMMMMLMMMMMMITIFDTIARSFIEILPLATF